MRWPSLFNSNFGRGTRFVLRLSLFIAGSALAIAQTGTIAGSVYDGQSGRPIGGVAVVLDTEVEKHQTDSDGRFTIVTSVGTHAVHFTYENYQPVDIRAVQVTAGNITEASTLMSNERVVTSIDVVEKLDAMTSTAEAMLVERKLSIVVSDSIGKQELSSGTAGDAAGALEKVTGVSVVGDGFVFVRGLGERYSATQLNGAVIPTTEPEKRVVPLDLFPTGMIDNVKIAKTYSADLPGEFSGGLVQLQTTEFPPKPTLAVSVKGGFNTMTTGKKFLTYPGGSNDYWGFGSGSRGIPTAVGSNRLVQGLFDATQLQEFGRAFSNNWESTPVDSQRPALDWSANGGHTIGKFGFVGALSFSNRPQVHQEQLRYIRQGGENAPFIFTDYPDFREYSEGARLGGVVNGAYRFSPNHKLLIRNTYTHDAEKTAREFGGFDGGTGGEIQAQRIRFIERKLFSTGLQGDHSLPKLANSFIHWQFTYSASNRDEPDLREVVRGRVADGRYVFSSSSNSGYRFYSELQDRIYEPQVDFGIPFFKGNVSGIFKVGFRSTMRSRDFAARRFVFRPQRLSTLDLFAPSNTLFASSNIRPDGFQINEFTRGTDKYDATMDVYAGYALIELNLGAKWRAAFGIRVEDATQQVNTVDNQVPGSVPVRAGLSNRDPVPSVNVIYNINPLQNFRMSFSRTLSRPDFRELSPFDFNNVLGGFITVGNANLRRATIDNYDVRWEMFPGGSQLVAASFFYKQFHDPIEQTILPSNDGRQSYTNARGARNMGIELEVRHDLGFAGARFKEFSVSSNFTLVDSKIDLYPADATIVTSQSRALLGQSRYVYNGGLSWMRPRWHSDASLTLGYVSRRISDVGTFGVPDIYQQGQTNVDFAYQYTRGERGQWAYRFEAENLNNNNFHWTQGPFTQRQYRLGRTFQVGLTYSFF
jgi:outer membrane receptor protein involved in Fe transport